jgi:SAM-dependent methyltransferase
VTIFSDATRTGADRPALMACTSLDHGTFGQIVECVACSIRFRSPREDDATILGLYEGVEDAVYLENERGRVLTFTRALDRLEALVSSRGPLLDVGCYTGVFLDVAAARGWPVTGVEPSRWAAAAARRRGHRVHNGTLDSIPPEWRSFAVVTMWDALEHYTDPVRELRRAHALVRDDGYLVLSTVNVDCGLVRLLGKRWPWYMRMHLSYFSPKTLTRALELAGWRVVSLGGYAHVVTCDYLLLKLGRYLPRASRALRAAFRRFGLAERTIAVDMGDFVTAYAQKAAS